MSECAHLWLSSLEASPGWLLVLCDDCGAGWLRETDLTFSVTCEAENEAEEPEELHGAG